MSMAFVVYNDFFNPQVMELLAATGIDYYTRWSDVHGKGAGTDAHVGRGGYPATNAVLMIAFEDTLPLQKLIDRITVWNSDVKRADDRIRLFQLPLERIV